MAELSKENSSVFLRFRVLALTALSLVFVSLPFSSSVAQSKDTPTAEQVAETVVFAYGARERLSYIRRTGVERGRITRVTSDGRTEEINYERSFKRGEKYEEDKIRLDQRHPNLEYSLIFSDGQVFGVLRGTPFAPRQDDVSGFMADRHHGVDTLLRYKESGAAITFVGKETHKGLDLWVLDLEDKEKKARTRYYISTKTGQVKWLEYEETPTGGGAPVKHRRTFHDYRVVQGTFVPYRTVLYVDGKRAEESHVLTVTYGVKIEDDAFQRPESAAGLP